MNWFSTTTQAVNTAFYVILVICVVMLILVTVLMVTFVIKYRRHRHPNADPVESHTVLEVTWTVVPTILALGMFYLGFAGYRFMRHPPGDALQVAATGRMWSWEFKYQNGKSSAELYVPQGVPVKVNLHSADVIHSFYVPAFRVKQDVVPGLDTYLWFQPVDTGIFDVFCAEYCGQRHSYMMSKVVVVPKDEFSKWVEKDVNIAAIPPPGAGESTEARTAQLRAVGERLSKVKGCVACHSTDGTRLVGPTYKGVFGRTVTVVTAGKKRQVVVDAEYIRRSILEPAADVVDGYQPVMPKPDITDEEINAIIEYLKNT